jgi:hypothetical protein
MRILRDSFKDFVPARGFLNSLEIRVLQQICGICEASVNVWTASPPIQPSLWG